MGLSNTQYDAIIHEYDVTRMRNNRIAQERLNYVLENVEGFREIEDSIINVSLDIGKHKISGDESTVSELRALLADLRSMRAGLLKGAGLDENFLEPIYTCPLCKDTGYIGTSKCSCFRRQITDYLYDQSNIKDYLQSNNFSTLSRDYYKNEDLLRFTRAEELCHNMVEHFNKVPTNLLLFGTVGCGKSFLSGCVAHEIIEAGYSVIYYSAISLFDNLAKETFNSKNKDELYNMYDYLYNCDLLIIDDLGTETSNSFVSSQLFALINERKLRKKSTIISTNLSLEEIRERYSDRILSRIASEYTVCKLSGPDIRLLKKQQLSIGK